MSRRLICKTDDGRGLGGDIQRQEAWDRPWCVSSANVLSVVRCPQPTDRSGGTVMMRLCVKRMSDVQKWCAVLRASSLQGSTKEEDNYLREKIHCGYDLDPVRTAKTAETAKKCGKSPSVV